MLRLPNPGSDINSFIRIFQVLFEELSDGPTFTLDAMSNVLVSRNLATSCGFMGATALTRSTRADRSRDPLYNQSKMYSELYRLLGWIHPQPDNRLLFNFTYLGAHAALSVKDPRALFTQSALCIAYPNEIVEVKASQAVRPFACTIKAMSALDGLICRDEIILGPLSIANDRDSSNVSRMVDMIRGLRGDWRRLEKALKTAAKQRGIAINTMHNYTRFPLAVLEWTGWTQKVRRNDIYGRAIVFHELTSAGVATVRWLATTIDLRAKDLDKREETIVVAIARAGLYGLLERAGFDTTPVKTVFDADLATLQRSGILKAGASGILFSPFHELPPQFSRTHFPITERYQEATLVKAAHIPQPSAEAARRITGLVTLSPAASSATTDARDSIARILHTTYQRAGRDAGKAADVFTSLQASATQASFYPLVAHLFSLLGYPCDSIRKGINYARWDALIPDAEESMPIEIKSPAEEQFLSVKSVRQALENKVVLLARKPFPTKLETTSLVVGYNLPSDRSEVNALIADIFKTYNISIGVIDFRSLVKLVIAHLFENRRCAPQALKRLHGIIQISDT